jgi:glycosyltransferase involved in cell wall biosynthesis
VKIPSVLGSLKRIYELQPEQIIVSTPGPVGLLGMLAGKLLAVPTKVIYHSDFTKEIGSLLESEQGMEVVESYVRWFHNLADEILVPTREYIGLLRQRGFDSAKLKLFRRGLDLQQYRHQPQGRSWLDEWLGLGEVPRLLYVGRVSKDKNLDLLRRTYEALAWPGSDRGRRWAVPGAVPPGLHPGRQRPFSRHREPAGPAAGMLRRRLAPLPQQDGHFRHCHAGGSGLRPARGGI